MQLHIIIYILDSKMAMLSSWISKGAEAITNSAKSIAHQHNQTIDTHAILKELLNRIEIKLSK